MDAPHLRALRRAAHSDVRGRSVRGGWPAACGDQRSSADRPNGIHSVYFSFNMSGHPAASVRAGMSDSGLPCGMQIIAERHRDDLVLQAAYAYEQARPWNDKWPDV